MLRRGFRWLLGPAALVAGLSAAEHRAGAEPAKCSFQDPIPTHDETGKGPATKYVNLSSEACRLELKRRKIETLPPKNSAPGVSAPLRFGSSLHGVKFTAPNAVYGILDCRLLLALDDFAELLSAHKIIEARLDNSYRANAHLPGKKKPSQHSFGLAADVLSFKFADGRELPVESAWRGKIGDAVCGPKAKLPDAGAGDAMTLRELVCEASRRKLFHHILTPNHDLAHKSHLHLDIAKNAHELMVE